jgi:hypothetical protein
MLFLTGLLLLEPQLQAAAEPVGSAGLSAARIAAYLFSAGVIGLGIRLILLGRGRSRAGMGIPEDDQVPPSGGFGWFAGLSATTQVVIGLGLVLIAYHIAAWVSPPQWFALQFPRERWWVVFVLVGIGVGGSLWAERLERS